jgi:hypothetical protein
MPPTQLQPPESDERKVYDSDSGHPSVRPNLNVAGGKGSSPKSDAAKSKYGEKMGGGGGKKGGGIGDVANKATDMVGKGFAPEAAAAKSFVEKAKGALVGGDKKRRNQLIGGGLVTTVIVGGILVMAGFLAQHEAVHIEQVIAQAESRFLSDMKKHYERKIVKKVYKKAKNAKAAEEDAKANPDEPLTDEIDKIAADPHALDPYLEARGLKPIYNGDNLVDVQDAEGNSVSPDDEAFSDIIDEMSVEDVIKVFDPVVVSQVGEPLDPFPKDDPNSEKDPQKTLDSDIKNGASDQAIAEADAKVNEQDAKQTDNKTKDADNAAKVAEEKAASGPLADAINTADDVAAKGGTAADAISAGVDAFKSKLGASLTDKFFITGMVTMICNFEKAVQVAADARVPEIMTLLMRNGGLFLAFADHEKNNAGPAKAPQLTSAQVKAMMSVVQGNPNAVKPTKSDPDPVEDMPFSRSAEWHSDLGLPVTNTTNPNGDNYTPASTAAASPTKNAGTKIVDTIQTFMNDTGFSFACQILTSAFGIIIQLAAGIGQIISSIGSFGAADAAILAGNIALQQFLFSYVLPQVLQYFTNLGIGLVSPVPFINNVGVGVNLSAGTASRFEGALPMTHAKTKTVQAQLVRAQFIEEQRKPFMYRAFAMDNPYSLTYRFMNNLPAPLTTRGILATISDYFVNLPSTLGRVFSDITAPKVFAATSTQLNPNTSDVTQYYAVYDYDVVQNEHYLRDKKSGVTVDGRTVARITMLGDPFAYQMSPAGDSNTDDLLHCFVDSPTIMTDDSAGNPNQKFCGALGRYDYESDDPGKLGMPDVTKIYCNYFGNPGGCAGIVAPQVHNDLERFSEYLGTKAAADSLKGMVGAN